MQSYWTWLNEAQTFRGYGGPKFNWKEYESDFHSGQYHQYNQLYDDVQNELYNLANQIKQAWKIDYRELIWFQDTLNPTQYTSGMTVESTWQEDFQGGVDNFQSLIDYLTEIEGAFDPEELKAYDRSKMDSVKRIMWDYEFDNLRDEDYDLTWGPYNWYPEAGEWERCRRIAFDHQEYPVTVLVNGKMIDGAHRLAVAIFKRQNYYPCLIGIPSHWFNK